MSEQELEFITWILVIAGVIGMLTIGRGCFNDDNVYQLEKLRIERACPEPSPRVK